MGRACQAPLLFRISEDGVLCFSAPVGGTRICPIFLSLEELPGFSIELKYSGRDYLKNRRIYGRTRKFFLQ
jgi:hypothetical protein